MHPRHFFSTIATFCASLRGKSSTPSSCVTRELELGGLKSCTSPVGRPAWVGSESAVAARTQLRDGESSSLQNNKIHSKNGTLPCPGSCLGASGPVSPSARNRLSRLVRFARQTPGARAASRTRPGRRCGVRPASSKSLVKANSRVVRFCLEHRGRTFQLDWSGENTHPMCGTVKSYKLCMQSSTDSDRPVTHPGCFGQRGQAGHEWKKRTEQCIATERGHRYKSQEATNGAKGNVNIWSWGEGGDACASGVVGFGSPANRELRETFRMWKQNNYIDTRRDMFRSEHACTKSSGFLRSRKLTVLCVSHCPFLS